MQQLVLVLSVHKLRSFVFGDSGNPDKVSDNFAKRGGPHSSSLFIFLRFVPVGDFGVIYTVLAFISSLGLCC